MCSSGPPRAARASAARRKARPSRPEGGRRRPPIAPCSSASSRSPFSSRDPDRDARRPFARSDPPASWSSALRTSRRCRTTAAARPKRGESSFMARYTDAVCKLCRREQQKLFLKGDKCYTKCVLEKKPGIPGMAKPQRGKPSAYSIRLREKQKLRRMIQMNERPFASKVAEASEAREASGDHLLRALELRLDNVVKRMGV